MPGSRRSNVGMSPAPVALVIDDSDIDREVMLDLLRTAGIEAYGLATPIGATRVAREKGARLVIIDQNQPAMDGNKLTTLFRANRSLAHTRVILVSSSDEQHMLELARKVEADAFVGKRYLHRELVATAKRLLNL